MSEIDTTTNTNITAATPTAQPQQIPYEQFLQEIMDEMGVAYPENLTEEQHARWTTFFGVLTDLYINDCIVFANIKYLYDQFSDIITNNYDNVDEYLRNLVNYKREQLETKDLVDSIEIANNFNDGFVQASKDLAPGYAEAYRYAFLNGEDALSFADQIKAADEQRNTIDSDRKLYDATDPRNRIDARNLTSPGYNQPISADGVAAMVDSNLSSIKSNALKPKVPRTVVPASVSVDDYGQSSSSSNNVTTPPASATVIPATAPKSEVEIVSPFQRKNANLTDLLGK